MHHELRVLRELPGQATPVLEDPLERRPEEPADLLAPRRFAVSVPEFDLVALTHPATTEKPAHHDPRRKVEPNDRLGALEDEVADDRVVRPVADPAVAFGRGGDASAQLVLAARLPVRAVP
jgi:hypothetical protein